MTKRHLAVAAAMTVITALYLLSFDVTGWATLIPVALGCVALYSLVIHPLLIGLTYTRTRRRELSFSDQVAPAARTLLDLANQTHGDYSRAALQILLTTLIAPRDTQQRLSVTSELTTEGYSSRIALEVTIPRHSVQLNEKYVPFALTLGANLPNTNSSLTAYGNQELIFATRGEANELVAQLLIEILVYWNEDHLSSEQLIKRMENVQNFLELALTIILYRRSDADLANILNELNHVYAPWLTREAYTIAESLIRAVHRHQYLIVLMSTERPAATLRYNVHHPLKYRRLTGFSAVTSSAKRWFSRESRSHKLYLSNAAFVGHFSLTMQFPRGYYVDDFSFTPSNLNWWRVNRAELGVLEIDVSQRSESVDSGLWLEATSSVHIAEIPPSSTATSTIAALVGATLIWLVGLTSSSHAPREIDGDILVFLLAFPIAASSRFGLASNKTATWAHSPASRLSAWVTAVLCASSAAMVLFTPDLNSYTSFSFLGVNSWPWEVVLSLSLMNALLVGSSLSWELARYLRACQQTSN